MIVTLDQLREIQAEGEGFIAITDDANPPRLHKAGCSAVREDNFARKVMQNAMRTGKYLHVADPAHARDQWSTLRERDCVA